MRTEQPVEIRRSDYAPPPYRIDGVSLVFDLAPTTTAVTARIAFAPWDADTPAHAPLRLDGEDLRLLEISIDGKALTSFDYVVEADALTISRPPSGAFTLETVGSARLETLAPEPALLDEGSAALPAKVLSVNVAGTHLKGMVDGKVVAHGHTAAPPPGRVGLRFEGTGVVGVTRIEAVRLDGGSH